MVKSTLKVIANMFIFCAVLVVQFVSIQNTNAVDNTNFNVNVKEAISVSISTPTVWASGDINTFLRNKIGVRVVSNNTAGFTASMTMKTTDTSLTNTAKNTISLPTLTTSTTRNSFPANYWGYSLDDTDAGNNSSTYRALVGSNGTPITLISSANAAYGTAEFYFGAKADATKAAGTYTGTVVISVVSGVIDNTNPVTPTDPAVPGTDQTAEYHGAPTGGSPSGTTTYSYASGDTRTTQISEGDNRNAYEGYTPPQGVTYKSNLGTSTNMMLAGGLAAAAAVSATSGMFFFILLKKRDDDEEEENPEIQQ